MLKYGWIIAGIAVALSAVGACGEGKGISVGEFDTLEGVYATAGKAAALYENGGQWVFQAGNKKFQVQEPSHVAVNPNGYVVAYRRNGKNWLYFQGTDRPLNQPVVTVVLSPDGGKYGWISTNGGWYVSVEGTRYGPYDYAGDLSFAPTGNSFAFQFTREGREYVCVNGEEMGGVDDMYGYSFSYDGTTCAFAYHDQWRDYLNVRGEIYGGYTKTNPPVFSMDGSRMAFVYSDGSSYFSKAFVNSDSEIAGPFDTVSNMTFSENGAKFGYIYIWKGKCFVTINGATNGSYDGAKGPYFAPEAAGTGYAYSLSNAWYAVVNGLVYGPFDEFYTMGFVSNQPGSWYAARNGNEAAIRYGTNTLSCGSALIEAGFLADGSKNYALYLSNGVTTLALDGNVVDTFDAAVVDWRKEENLLNVAGLRDGRLYYKQYRM